MDRPGGVGRDIPRSERPVAVYRLYGTRGELLYVGASVDPRVRVAAHRKTQPWAAEIDPTRTTWKFYETRELAGAKEEEAILTERPLHNVAGAARRYQRYTTKRPLLDYLTAQEVARLLGVTRERAHELMVDMPGVWVSDGPEPKYRLPPSALIQHICATYGPRS